MTALGLSLIMLRSFSKIPSSANVSDRMLEGTTYKGLGAPVIRAWQMRTMRAGRKRPNHSSRFMIRWSAAVENYPICIRTHALSQVVSAHEFEQDFMKMNRHPQVAVHFQEAQDRRHPDRKHCKELRVVAKSPGPELGDAVTGAELLG